MSNKLYEFVVNGSWILRYHGSSLHTALHKLAETLEAGESTKHPSIGVKIEILTRCIGKDCPKCRRVCNGTATCSECMKKALDQNTPTSEVLKLVRGEAGNSPLPKELKENIINRPMENNSGVSLWLR